VYKHFQFKSSGDLPEDYKDDFHSPTQPSRYIELRIEEKIEFYQSRTPSYAWQRCSFKALLLACTLAATILSRYRMDTWVIATASAATAITSWDEFTDVTRKVERCTQAAYELRNLHSWWKSLSEVEKASKSTITKLIHDAEGIITQERTAWLSTANKSRVEEKQEGEPLQEPVNGKLKGKEQRGSKDAYAA
jgi:hypothetical protein